MLVVATAGVQLEMDLPFAGLHQLPRPVFPQIDSLPAAQRDAISAAFGKAAGPAAPELFMIALATLDLLSDAAAKMPVALIVEDARALLADDEDAGAVFQYGLSRDLTLWPFTRARLQLAYGEWLRPPMACRTVRSASGCTSRTVRSNRTCTGCIPNSGSRPARSWPACSRPGWARPAERVRDVARLSADRPDVKICLVVLVRLIPGAGHVVSCAEPVLIPVKISGINASSLGELDMSHHLDTQLARQNGQLYIDDLYVFPGDHSTVLVMDVNSTITGPDVQPGFHQEARYEFKLHFDGAEFEELTYRVSFGEPEAGGRQAFLVHALINDQAREDSAAGVLVLEGRTGEVASAGDARAWAGRIADPFYIDLSLLNIVNGAVKTGAAPDLPGWRPENARNSFAGTTVESIVLEISHQHPRLHAGARTGVWAATKLATDAGGWRQINRAGHPMMWPIFWPGDTDFSDPANERHPSADFTDEGKHIGDLVTAVVAATGTSADPPGYGQTVARELFPDVLPYAVGTPASYGFAGFNGRTLADNAPEAMLSLVLSTAVPCGLTPAVSEHLRRGRFPYVVAA
jgi:hypothetical protein